MTIDQAILSKLPSALAMKETIYSLKYIERKISIDNCQLNVDDYLNIDLIKQGFDAYKSQQVDELYFKVWCKLISKLYAIKFDKVVHGYFDYDDSIRPYIGYKLISKVVYNAPKQSDYDQLLHEIAYHQAVLDGIEPCNYPLAKDFEFFECFGDSNYYRDVLQINHHQKTYFLSSNSRDEFWEENLDYDFERNGRYNVELHGVHEITFQLIIDGLKKAGYTETDKFYLVDNDNIICTEY